MKVKSYDDLGILCFRIAMIFFGIALIFLVDPIRKSNPYFYQNAIVMCGCMLSCPISMLVYEPLRNVLSNLKRKTINLIFITCLTVISVFSSIFVFFVGNRQFNAYDLSMLISLGYRQLLGQKPHKDFFCAIPPGFYLPIKYSFQLFGCTWDAVLILTCIFSVVSFVWMSVLLRSITNDTILSVTLPLACQATGIYFTTHWWYNSVTSICAGIYICSAILLLMSPKRFSRISYFCSLFILVLLKPNVAGVTIACVVFVMVFYNNNLLKFLFSNILTLICSGLYLLYFCGINIQDIFNDYIAIASSRISPKLQFPFSSLGILDYNENMFFLAMLIMPIIINIFVGWIDFTVFITSLRRSGVGFINYIKGNVMYYIVKLKILLLITTGILAGFYGLTTSTDSKFTDFPLVILSIGLIPSLKRIIKKVLIINHIDLPVNNEKDINIVSHVNIYDQPKKRNILLIIQNIIKRDIGIWLLKKIIFMCCICFTTAGILFGLVRYRHSLGGPYFEVSGDMKKAKNHFFCDLYSGSWFRDTLNQLDDVVNLNRGKKIFFATRLEFAYAAFHVPMYSKLPVLWHPGTSYPLSYESTIIKDWISNKFDVVIANKNDFACMPSGIVINIKSHYTLDDIKYHNLAVYYLKK